ncbi:MAG: hypothetical protein KME45_21075 [Stenomitos rutilans HA7619-LM2]|nr:hypothetical protein [Stenomitos rutilans HA7619-LM2]
MTRPSQSPDSSPCLIRPAQACDRKAIERLVRQFHQSLQISQIKWIKQLPHEVLWATRLELGH